MPEYSPELKGIFSLSEDHPTDSNQFGQEVLRVDIRRFQKQFRCILILQSDPVQSRRKKEMKKLERLSRPIVLFAVV